MSVGCGSAATAEGPRAAAGGTDSSGASGGKGGGGPGKDGGGPDAPGLTAYSSYCTAKLSKPRAYSRATFTNNWQGSGESAAAGTEVLLDVRNARFGGFVRLADGQWAQLDVGGETPFVKGVDFESDCAPPEPPGFDSPRVVVTIGRATLYRDVDRTGAPCVVPAGTEIGELASYDWLGGDKPAAISSKKVLALCGFEKAFTADYHTGDLVRRSGTAAH